MAKFVFFVPPHLGHINPTIGIGAKLLKNGHSVIWLAFSEIPPSLIPKGGIFLIPDTFKKEEKVINSILERQDEAANNTSNKMIKWAFESTWIPFYHLTIQHLPKILEDLKPDLLFYDEALFGAAICAYKQRIPYVTSITHLPGLFTKEKVLIPEDDKWLSEIMNSFLRDNKVNRDVEILNSELASITFTSEEFLFNRELPKKYKFIGPSIEGREKKESLNELFINENRPIIYVSVGSLLNDIKKVFYKKIIDAFTETNYTIIVVANPDLFQTWPNNFHVKSFWPQLEILKKTDVVITAGGLNTINESLFFDVPMLIIPLANDQFGNADLIAKQGCGIKRRFRRLTSDQLKLDTEEIINDEKYKLQAKKIGASLRKGGGSERASEILENLAMELSLLND